MLENEAGSCSVTYAGAAVSGMVAGMRSMAAPVIVSQLGLSELLPVNSRPLTAALALGEAVADKLPFIPSRTMPMGLVARAVTGGFSGASISRSRRCSPVWGAALGAAAAIGTAYAMAELRKELGKKLHLPDFVLALLEDSLVVALAASLLSRFKAQTGSAPFAKTG